MSRVFLGYDDGQHHEEGDRAYHGYLDHFGYHESLLYRDHLAGLDHARVDDDLGHLSCRLAGRLVYQVDGRLFYRLCEHHDGAADHLYGPCPFHGLGLGGHQRDEEPSRGQ